MKTMSVVAAVVAAALSLSTAVFAQTGPHVGPGDHERYNENAREWRHDRRDPRRDDRWDHRRDDRRDHRRDDRWDHRRDDRRDQRWDGHRRDQRWDGHRRDNQRWQSPPRHDGGRHLQPRDIRYQEHWDHRDPRWNQGWHRGAGPRHDFYRGSRLPSYYRSPVYVVNDWHGHHLRPPPVGYHWVQAGGDYVLAAIATGLILSIVLSN